MIFSHILLTIFDYESLWKLNSALQSVLCTDWQNLKLGKHFKDILKVVKTWISHASMEMREWHSKSPIPDETSPRRHSTEKEFIRIQSFFVWKIAHKSINNGKWPKRDTLSQIDVLLLVTNASRKNPA